MREMGREKLNSRINADILKFMTRNRRPKTFEERFAELVGDFKKMGVSLKKFETTNEDHWIQLVAGLLYKLLVKSRSNHPLFLELAEKKKYPLVVYVSNIAIATEKSVEKGNLPAPSGSFIPNILSPKPVPLYNYPMVLEEALNFRCYIIRSTKYTFKDILENIRHTEGFHSDPRKPETLDTLGKIDMSGHSGAYMAIYHLGNVVMELVIEFTNYVNSNP